MTKARNKFTGNKGETYAAEELQKKGYKVLARNYRSKWGEIDIVAKDRDTVVFVEVKTKTSDNYGEPWEMINRWKIEQVKRMGEMWCREFGWEGLVRMDGVGVYMNQDGDVEKIEHWENVE